jgi:hypothetical protein
MSNSEFSFGSCFIFCCIGAGALMAFVAFLQKLTLI